MSKEEKTLSPLEAKISQAYRVNEAVEDEQREIEVRLNKIEGLKPLLPNRKYGQKWEDLEFGISAQSLIERGDAPLAGYLKLTSGDLSWDGYTDVEKIRKLEFLSDNVGMCVFTLRSSFVYKDIQNSDLATVTAILKKINNQWKLSWMHRSSGDSDLSLWDL